MVRELFTVTALSQHFLHISQQVFGPSCLTGREALRIGGKVAQAEANGERGRPLPGCIVAGQVFRPSRPRLQPLASQAQRQVVGKGGLAAPRLTAQHQVRVVQKDAQRRKTLLFGRLINSPDGTHALAFLGGAFGRVQRDVHPLQAHLQACGGAGAGIAAHQGQVATL